MSISDLLILLNRILSNGEELDPQSLDLFGEKNPQF